MNIGGKLFGKRADRQIRRPSGRWGLRGRHPQGGRKRGSAGCQM
jgi:hypothetical protein